MAEDLVAQAQAELARKRTIEAARSELARRQPATGAPDAGVTAPTPQNAAPDYNLPEGYSVQETDRGRFIVSPEGQWRPIEVDGDNQGGFTERALEQNPNDLARASRISDQAQFMDAGTGGPSRTQGLAGQFVEGAPFVGSYADEAAGVVAGAFGGDGEAVTTRAREMLDATRVANPKASVGANVAGAVTGSVPLAVAGGIAMAGRGAATLGGKAIQGLAIGAGLGATEGATYGYGLGEGDERAKNATTGGILGGGIGGLVGGAAPYVGAGIRKAVNNIRGTDVAEIAGELGTSREAATVVRNALTGSDQAASRANILRGGEGAMLADANAATQRLVDTAAQMPGNAGATARNAVSQRTRAATAQMTGALDDALGAPEGAGGLVRDIMQDSAPARRAAYDAAYAKPINYADDTGRNIERVLSRVDPAVLSRAVREANMQMRDLGVNNQQIRATLGDAGEVVFDTMPDVRQLDALKQALDTVAENSKNALGIMSPEGRRYAGQARSLRQAIGDAVPEYNAAVSLGGQAISERNAVTTGREMLTARVTREQVAESLEGATGAELSSARQGVRSYIDDVTANVARTVTDPDTTTREGIRVLRDLSSRSNQTKLRTLLGTQRAEKLLAQIDEAATGFELRAAIAENSKTAARQATQGSIDEQTAPGILRTLAHGDAVDSARLITQAITGETTESRAIREMGLYREIASLLVNTRGPKANAALEIVQRAVAGQQITDVQADLISRTVVDSLTPLVPSAGREASTALGAR